MIVAFSDRSSRTHRRHQRRRSSNSSSSKNSKQSSDDVDVRPYDKRQSDGSRSSQRSQRSYNKKNSSSSRRNKKSSTTRRSSGGRSSKKTHKSPVEIRKDNVMLDELDKHIPPALKEQDIKKGKVVSEIKVHRPRRRESTDDPRISWGSVLRPGLPGRRDSQSSVGSEVIVEFPKERRRPSYNSTGSSGRVINTDNLSLCGFMKRRKSKGGGSITGISISDRTSSSCPAKPQLCTDRRCHHNKRTHTSTRHFKHTVDWRTSSIDWGDSTDDECSSMCGTVDGSDDDDDESEFRPQQIVRRGRDPAGHYSGRNLLDRSIYSDGRIDSSENPGRTLSESFSSLLSGTFRKPDP